MNSNRRKAMLATVQLIAIGAGILLGNWGYTLISS